MFCDGSKGKAFCITNVFVVIHQHGFIDSMKSASYRRADELAEVPFRPGYTGGRYQVKKFRLSFSHSYIPSILENFGKRASAGV